MTEEKYRAWDTAIKVFGFVGVILSACIAVAQFRDQREREMKLSAETKEREFYSQFWNQRLALYIKTLDVAAKISTAATLQDSAQPRAEFWTLFDGSMAVVQDPKVDHAMHEFAAKLRQVEAGDMKPKDLGIHSYTLGRICYDSLRDSWDKPFTAEFDKGGRQ